MALFRMEWITQVGGGEVCCPHPDVIRAVVCLQC